MRQLLGNSAANTFSAATNKHATTEEFLQVVFSLWYVQRFCNEDTCRVDRFHGPLKVIAFNANDIWRQRYELSKQLQDLHVDVALLSETHLKPRERLFIPNYRSSD
jgi:hypothetical protein